MLAPDEVEVTELEDAAEEDDVSAPLQRDGMDVSRYLTLKPEDLKYRDLAITENQYGYKNRVLETAQPGDKLEKLVLSYCEEFIYRKVNTPEKKDFSDVSEENNVNLLMNALQNNLSPFDQQGRLKNWVTLVPEDEVNEFTEYLKNIHRMAAWLVHDHTGAVKQWVIDYLHTGVEEFKETDEEIREYMVEAVMARILSVLGKAKERNELKNLADVTIQLINLQKNMNGKFIKELAMLEKNIALDNPELKLFLNSSLIQPLFESAVELKQNLLFFPYIDSGKWIPLLRAVNQFSQFLIDDFPYARGSGKRVTGLMLIGLGICSIVGGLIAAYFTGGYSLSLSFNIGRALIFAGVLGIAAGYSLTKWGVAEKKQDIAERKWGLADSIGQFLNEVRESSSEALEGQAGEAKQEVNGLRSVATSQRQ